MSDSWRNDLVSLRNRRLVFWAVVISLLVHILFVLALIWLPIHGKLPVSEDPPIWIDASNLDVSGRPQGRIVPAPMPSNEKAPPRANHLAERDNAVEKETHRADIPINENPDEVGPRTQKPAPRIPSIEKKYKIPDVGEAMAPKSGGKVTAEKPVEGGDQGSPKTGRKSLDQLVDSVGYGSERPRSGGASGGGNLSPYNPDVGEAGDAISLNTRNFKYIGYFAGLKEKIEWAWVYPQEAQMMGQQGMLTLSFTILRDGRLKEVKQVHSSGFPLLDRAAKRAVEDAADFAPFPASWPDEELTIVANFSYQLIGAKSVF